MRTRILVALVVFAAVGCPSEIPPPPPPPPPPLPPCEGLLQGRAVSQEAALGGIPATGVAARGMVGDWEIALGESGRELWYAGAGGATRAVLDGPDLPIGARMLPILDWGLSAFNEPPVILALVTEGHGEACLLDGREPLELESATGGAVPPDTNALAATIALRYLKTCPASPDECVIYGDPSAVAAVRDPNEPPGGFFVRVQDAIAAPEDLPYEKLTLPERAEPSGPYTVYRLVKTGNVSGFGVEVEHFTTEDGVHNYARLFLKKRRTRIHAFDLDLGRDTVWLAANLHLDGDRLVLWVTWPSLGFTLSVHNKRSGERTGEPLSLGLSPYYDMGAEGIDGVGLFPVLGRDPIGAALWDPAQRQAVFYAGPDAEPEWQDVELPAEFDPAADWARFFTGQDGKLIPTFEPEEE